jgi:hypothetical protein
MAHQGLARHYHDYRRAEVTLPVREGGVTPALVAVLTIQEHADPINTGG